MSIFRPRGLSLFGKKERKQKKEKEKIFAGTPQFL